MAHNLLRGRLWCNIIPPNQPFRFSWPLATCSEQKCFTPLERENQWDFLLETTSSFNQVCVMPQFIVQSLLQIKTDV